MAVIKRRIVKIAGRGIKGAALCCIAFTAQQAHAHPKDINGCTNITKPGSYILADDIVFNGPENGVCIQVMADRVSINLDGHTISWAGPLTISNLTIAIKAASDTEHVKVQNGTISGFGSGVQLLGEGSTVADMHVGGPCPCDGVGIEAYGVIKDNVVNVASVPEGGGGIGGAGVIKGNYVYNTRSTGIGVAANSVVVGNTVVDTFGYPGYGMRVSCPSIVAHNTVTGSWGKNLVLNGEGCVAKDNNAP